MSHAIESILPLLVRYFADDCTPEQRSEVEQWIASSLDHRRSFEQLHRAWQSVHRYEPSGDEGEILARLVASHIAAERQAGTGREKEFSEGRAQISRSRYSRERAIPGLGTRSLRRTSSESWMGTSKIFSRRTGVIALLTGAVFGAALYVDGAFRHPPLQAARAYATGPGQRLKVHLTDGTEVILAPQTSLQVGAGFDTRERDVTLTGQAYFQVSAAADRPFTVHTGDVTSRVLGTTFMVRRYAGEHEVVVAVQSGKVSAGRGNPVMLTSGTLARITDSTVFLTTNADLREYMEWRDGQLSFAGATAREITKVLGQWYGLTFQFADSSMPNRLLSGVFDDRAPRQDVLKDLQILLDARMTFHGNLVTITPKNTAATPRVRREVREDQQLFPTEVGR